MINIKSKTIKIKEKDNELIGSYIVINNQLYKINLDESMKFISGSNWFNSGDTELLMDDFDYFN